MNIERLLFRVWRVIAVERPARRGSILRARCWHARAATPRIQGQPANGAGGPQVERDWIDGWRSVHFAPPFFAACFNALNFFAQASHFATCARTSTAMEVSADSVKIDLEPHLKVISTICARPVEWSPFVIAFNAFLTWNAFTSRRLSSRPSSHRARLFWRPWLPPRLLSRGARRPTRR